MANYTQMLLDLNTEKQQLEQVIHLVERLAIGGKRRRGRPPKWMKQADPPVPALVRKRKPFTAETRRKMAASQKLRWAAKRKSA